MSATPPSWVKSQDLDIDSHNGLYQSEILPFYHSKPLQQFTGVGGLKIAYKAFQQQDEKSTAIVFSTGRSESMLKYQEIIYELYQLGFSIYIHDHRGQGLSSRIKGVHPHLGDIDNVDNYLIDLDIFIKNIIPSTHNRYHLIGHSMGAAVVLRYLTYYRHPFEKIILSAPMLEPRMINRPLTYFSALFTLPLSRFFNNYVITQGPYRYRGEDSISKLRNYSERHRLIRRIYQQEPRIQLGGPSRRWLYQWTRYMGEMQAIADTLDTPTLVLKAEIETAVNNAAIDGFLKRLSYNDYAAHRSYTIQGGRHELFHESDEYRNQALNQIWNFLNSTPS